MRGWQPDDEDWIDIRRGFLSGAAAGLVVVAWMWLAHPGEESISSRGFDMGGGFSASPSNRPAGSSMIFARRGQNEAPASVRPEAPPGPSSPMPYAGTAVAPVAPIAPAAPAASGGQAAAAPEAS